MLVRKRHYGINQKNGKRGLEVITYLRASKVDARARSAAATIPESSTAKEKYVRQDVRLLSRIECEESDDTTI